MIISKIIGGLGNQMFQYAIGRAVSRKFGQELFLDIEDYKTYRRPYYLDRFNVNANYISSEQAVKYRRYESRFSPYLFLNNMMSWAKRFYRLEKPSEYFQYIPEFAVVSAEKGAYFNGYWQNEKYFNNIRGTLLEEFTLRLKYEIKNIDIVGLINNTESVSVHFRRGDDQLNKSYGVPPMNYYISAVEYLANKLRGRNLNFFVFSNEPEWAQKNFKINYPTIHVSMDYQLEDYQELAAMSQCRYNIITNSTFSWWAAWLNKNPDTIIIAPKKYFINANIYTHDFIPERWIKI